MKNGKANRAMGQIDDRLIASAMNESDLNQEKSAVIVGRKQPMWKKWVALAAMLAIVLSCGIFISRNTGAGAVVALDVNPSLELVINAKEEVKEVRALNEEARQVIGTMELKGVDLEVAMNAIIGSMVNHGYLSENQNSILVSVDAKKKADAPALKEKLSQKISALLGSSQIAASVLVQEFEKNTDAAKIAEENNISEAKATLIEKIVASGLLDAHGVPYTKEALAKMKVNELKLILEAKNWQDNDVGFSGTASDKQYLSAEQAQALALERAGFAKEEVSRLQVELDFDDDVWSLVYEVEFRAGEKKYEYEIHAKSGEVLEWESKTPDRDEEDKIESLPTDVISREKALEIACADAGVDRNSIRRPEIEADLEKGVYVYEIEFDAGEKEYEYEIDARTGAILKRESERKD